MSRRVLDVTFNEDGCRICRGDDAQNFAILRRIALNLIKQKKSDKASVGNLQCSCNFSLASCG